MCVCACAVDAVDIMTGLHRLYELKRCVAVWRRRVEAWRNKRIHFQVCCVCCVCARVCVCAFMLVRLFSVMSPVFSLPFSCSGCAAVQSPLTAPPVVLRVAGLRAAMPGQTSSDGCVPVHSCVPLFVCVYVCVTVCACVCVWADHRTAHLLGRVFHRLRARAAARK